MATVPIIEYFKPLRPIITIRDKTNDPTYLFHDSFNPPDPSSGSPAIYYCDVDLAYGQAGTFVLRINDHEHQLDTSKIGLGNRVWIEAGRTEGSVKQIFSGVCRTMKPIRQNYKLLGYEMSGFGTQIIMNERVVNYIRTALRNPGNTQKPFVDDPNMKAWKLFRTLLEQNNVIPLGYPAIKHTLYPGMFNTVDDIDQRVDTFIASLTEPYVEASQVANSIADMAGGIWGVRSTSPGSAHDHVFLRFPSTSHSGTIIKDKPADPLEYTNQNVAYLRAGQGGFSYTDSMRKEDGFTNRIFSKTGADIASGSTSSTADNFTALANLDIAQQFTVNSTRFRDLAFTLGIEGVGEQIGNSSSVYSPTIHRITIVDDSGGRPGSNVQFATTFPREVQNGEVKTVFIKIPTNFSFPTISPGQKAWVIMFNNSSVLFPEGRVNDCGVATSDQSIHWHHDGGNIGISAVRTICHTHPKGEPLQRDPVTEDTTSGWVINNAGPTYSHSFFDQFSHIIEASDNESIARYGQVDSFIDASFLTDENSMNQYLSSILQYAAKPRRIYEVAELFIPYQKLIEPGELVTIIDPESGHTPERHLTAEVQEVRYEFAADASGSNPLGTNTCEVRLLGYVDYREQEVMAISEQAIQVPIPPPSGQPPPEPPPPEPGPGPDPLLDTDGIKILMKQNTSQGKFHRNMVGLPNLGASTWTSSTYFKHDCQGNSASKNTSGSLTYWTMQAREGSFASTGETNYTCRPTWVSDSRSTPAGLSGAKSRGYLATANDPRNIEFTAVIRVKQIEDNDEEATFKWCGDTHSDTSEKTLQGACKFPYGGNDSELFAFEKTHPSDRRGNVTFISPFTASNMPKVSSNTWRGIKTIVYRINNNQGLHCEWWMDSDPIDPAGGFKNNWKKIAIYEEQKSDTPVWGGPHNTLRTDMAHEVDIAAFNIHEIVPPGTTANNTGQALGQTAPPEVLAERGEYEESTGLQHPDYISEMVPVGEDISSNMFTKTDGITPETDMEFTTSETEGQTAGRPLVPKIIPREPDPITEEIDEIDQTFGDIDMSGEDP